MILVFGQTYYIAGTLCLLFRFWPFPVRIIVLSILTMKEFCLFLSGCDENVVFWTSTGTERSRVASFDRTSIVWIVSVSSGVVVIQCFKWVLGGRFQWVFTSTSTIGTEFVLVLTFNGNLLPAAWLAFPLFFFKYHDVTLMYHSYFFSLWWHEDDDENHGDGVIYGVEARDISLITRRLTYFIWFIWPSRWMKS